MSNKLGMRGRNQTYVVAEENAGIIRAADADACTRTGTNTTAAWKTFEIVDAILDDICGGVIEYIAIRRIDLP